MLELRVHRWRHELAVPRHLDAARSQAAAADLQAMTHEIAALLAGALERELDDDAVLLLPMLCIDGRFDLGADRHQACAHWAGELARQLLRALDDPAGSAVRFASPAHHAAAYLLARTRGNAAGCWWWRGFDGLALLPLAQALRTLLAESAPGGLAMLAALGEAEAVPVLAALGQAEGWRVLLAWCEQLEAAAGPVAVARWPGLPALLQAAPAVEEPATWALLALRRQALAHGPQAMGPAHVVHAAAAALLLRAEAVGAAMPGRELLQPASALARALLQRLDARSRRTLARAVRQALRPASAGAGAAPDEELPTAFGGAAWLLHAVQDLLAPAVRWPWPATLPAPGAGLFALLVLAAAMPPSRALAAWRDPAWRRLLGVPTALDLAAACGALAAAGAAAGAAHQAWSDWLARTARQVAPLRVPQPRAGPGRPWPVDRASGLWLDAATAQSLPVAPGPLLAERLAMTRAVRAEAAFLAANEVTQRLPAAWQPLVLRFAHAALRRLAARLPGLSWASAGHLHANLLGVRGTLLPAAAGDDWVLQLERAPLDVLLTMTGLVRARWPVLPGCWLALARAEGGRP